MVGSEGTAPSGINANGASTAVAVEGLSKVLRTIEERRALGKRTKIEERLRPKGEPPSQEFEFVWDNFPEIGEGEVFIPQATKSTDGEAWRG